MQPNRATFRRWGDGYRIIFLEFHHRYQPRPPTSTEPVQDLFGEKPCWSCRNLDMRLLLFVGQIEQEPWEISSPVGLISFSWSHTKYRHYSSAFRMLSALFANHGMPATQLLSATSVLHDVRSSQMGPYASQTSPGIEKRRDQKFLPKLRACLSTFLGHLLGTKQAFHGA